MFVHDAFFAYMPAKVITGWIVHRRGKGESGLRHNSRIHFRILKTRCVAEFVWYASALSTFKHDMVVFKIFVIYKVYVLC